jgi:hypothetical protein
MVIGEWMALGLALQEAALGDAPPVLIEAINRQVQTAGPWPFPHELRQVRLSAATGAGPSQLPPPDEPSIWIARPGDGTVAPLPLSIAQALLDDLPPGTVIDVDALGAADSEPPRFAALRRLNRDHALTASRPAALVLDTICEGCRSVLSGEAAGPAGPVEVYDLLLKSA